MKRIRLPKIDAPLAAALLLAAALATGAHLLDSRARRQIPELHRAHQIRQRVALAYALVAESEAARRAFVISGDESHLEPHAQAESDLRRLLNDIDTLAAGPPSEASERLPALRARMEGKLQAGSEIIDAYRQGGIEAARALLRADRAPKAMDDIRRRADQLDGRSLESIENADTDLRRDLDTSRWLAAGAALAALIALPRAFRPRPD